MCNLAFEHLDMCIPEVEEAMKGWILNGDTVPAAGDKLYDLMWLSENHKQLSYNKCFAYRTIVGGTWKDVVLLCPAGGYPAYTEFDSANFDMYKMQLAFYKGDSMFYAGTFVL